MTDSKLRPVRKESLMQRAYLELREALLAGRFAPGEPVTVRELAEEMQVGIMPVRECVRQLSAEGALEFMPNRSVRVPALTATEFEELFEVRMVNESFAAQKAAANIGKKDLQKVGRYLEQLTALQNGQDAHACLLANMHFHFAVYRGSGSTLLVEIIERLWLRVSPLLIVPYSSPAEQRAEFFSSLGTHEALLDALGRRDTSAAADLTRAILTKSRDWHLAYNAALQVEEERSARFA